VDPKEDRRKIIKGPLRQKKKVLPLLLVLETLLANKRKIEGRKSKPKISEQWNKKPWKRL
jgi:hypothetical protein